MLINALASHLLEDMFEEVLGVVQEMPGEEERAKMLEALVPLLVALMLIFKMSVHR